MNTDSESEFPKTPANHTPLSPLSFLRRASSVFPSHPAAIYAGRRYAWSDVYDRACQLANALRRLGVKEGDTVSIVAANTPELFEAHYGVPMAGAVLNTINVRLEPATIAHILRHSQCRLLIFSPAVKTALATHGDVEVIDIVDDLAVLKPGEGERLGWRCRRHQSEELRPLGPDARHGPPGLEDLVERRNPRIVFERSTHVSPGPGPSMRSALPIS